MEPMAKAFNTVPATPSEAQDPKKRPKALKALSLAHGTGMRFWSPKPSPPPPNLNATSGPGLHGCRYLVEVLDTYLLLKINDTLSFLIY